MISGCKVHEDDLEDLEKTEREAIEAMKTKLFTKVLKLCSISLSLSHFCSVLVIGAIYQSAIVLFLVNGATFCSVLGTEAIWQSAIAMFLVTGATFCSFLVTGATFCSVLSTEATFSYVLVIGAICESLLFCFLSLEPLFVLF